jgi:hypothetical protein
LNRVDFLVPIRGLAAFYGKTCSNYDSTQRRTLMPDMFILKATYNGYSGGDLWLSYSADNYVILYDSSAVYMWQKDDGHLQAPSSNFPLAINDKQLAQYGDRASWRDFAFNMQGDAVVFIDGQIAIASDQGKRLCVKAGDDRRVHWSNSTSDPSTNYLQFTKIPRA